MDAVINLVCCKWISPWSFKNQCIRQLRYTNKIDISDFGNIVYKDIGCMDKNLNKLLNGVSKKYLRKTTWSVIIYWEIIVLSILISGSIKETDLIVCSGIIVGEGILFLLIRGFYYIDIMEKYHPHAINMDSYPIDLYSADEKKRQISDNLDKIQETTHNTEVLKALELRRAMVLIIVHAEVPVFTMFNLGCLGLIK